MKIGIIIGRFQTDKLHSGYLYLIGQILSECDGFAFAIGWNTLPPTRHNPFTVVERSKIINREIERLNLSHKFYDIATIQDRKEDSAWSENVDDALDILARNIITLGGFADVELVLYGSKDCFAKYYNGTYPVREIKPIDETISSTDRREQMFENSKNIHQVTDQYLLGKINAIYSQYPKVYPTVDIAILNEHGEILLGRKPFETKFRFPGGFVDVSDESYEAAAKREAIEECGKIELDNFAYVCSMQIDDWRYRAEKDKITSTLFKCRYIYGAPKGSDDLAEVKWVRLSDITEETLVGEHWKMFQKLLANLNTQ